jgi:hypothetical protein
VADPDKDVVLKEIPTAIELIYRAQYQQTVKVHLSLPTRSRSKALREQMALKIPVEVTAIAQTA